MLKALLFTLSLSTSLLATEKPNIILIMADDLGWGDVGFNGNTVIKTPHLDQMAANGLQMNRFYSASAVCSPTRASCLTGRNPYRVGIPNANTGRLEKQELTLAEALRNQGYATGHFGKWHLGTLTKTVKDANRGGPRGVAHFSPPWTNGFDTCFSTESKVPTYDPMLVPKKVDRKFGWPAISDKSKATSYGTHYWNENSEIVTDNLAGDNSKIIVDRLIPFMDQSQQSNKAFFAVVWFHTPHLPVVASPQHFAMYEGSELERNYYGCITAMDEQIGRIRKHLAKQGLAQNTIITFASDNGPEGKKGQAPGSAGKFRGRKRSVHEGGIRVPAIIEWPAVIKPRKTNFPSYTSDYLPTIFDILKIPLPTDRLIDGESILPILKGEQTMPRKPMVFKYLTHSAVMNQQWKLVKKKKNTELYDLLSDPYETENLAKKHPEHVNSLNKVLTTFTQSLSNKLDSQETP